jgi:hypothetical protein
MSLEHVLSIRTFEQEVPMHKFWIPIATAATLAIATPALAYDSGGTVSMQLALDVATNIGLVTVSHTEFAGDEWQIEGRDELGRYMEVDVDSTTGQVLNVDR